MNSGLRSWTTTLVAAGGLLVSAGLAQAASAQGGPDKQAIIATHSHPCQSARNVAVILQMRTIININMALDGHSLARPAPTLPPICNLLCLTLAVRPIHIRTNSEQTHWNREQKACISHACASHPPADPPGSDT